MRTKLCRMPRGMLLVAGIGILALSWFGSLYGATNCQTQQCVQVAYKASSNSDPSNLYGWYTSYDRANRMYIGKSYSTTYAAKGYGSVSDPNNPYVDPQSGVSGWYRPCENNKTDCDGDGLGNGILPVSGSLPVWTDVAQNADFPTKCRATSPSQ